MSRWKREFRLWAKREGLEVYAMPKKPTDWDKAKVMSQMVAWHMHNMSLKQSPR